MPSSHSEGRLGIITNGGPHFNSTLNSVDDARARTMYALRWKLLMAGRFERKDHPGLQPHRYVPLVVVRHPMLWLFKSMCRSSYNVWSTEEAQRWRSKTLSAIPREPPLRVGPTCDADLVGGSVSIGKFNTGVRAARFVQNTFARKVKALRGVPTEGQLNSNRWLLSESDLNRTVGRDHGHADVSGGNYNYPGCNRCIKMRGMTRDNHIYPWHEGEMPIGAEEASFSCPGADACNAHLEYESVLDLWTDYYASFVDLYKSRGLPVMFVRHEDLLLHPFEVHAAILKTTSNTTLSRDNFWNEERNSKYSGGAKKAGRCKIIRTSRSRSH